MQPGSKPPPGPTGLPPLGDLRELQKSPLGVMLKTAHQYGDLVRYPLGPLRVYLASHPDYVKHVLLDNNRNYSKDTFQYNLLRSVTGNGLLTSDGAIWLQQRRLLQPAFHRERLAGLAPLILSATEGTLACWRPLAELGRPVDVAEEMMELTLDIVGRALFSIDMRRDARALGQAVLTVLDHIVHRARTMSIIPLSLPIRSNRRFWAAMHILDRAVYELVEARRRGDEAGDDLLSMLIAAQDPDTGVGMSDRQVRDEVLTLIIAGHETVASALSWTWYLLAEHPAAVAKLRAELQEVLGGRPPTAADLHALPYTRMVIEEALRLYPPAWIITRRTIEDDEIGGYHIPRKSLVVLSPYVTHRHLSFWEHPERFDPERFHPDRAGALPRFAYFPFGGGPRLCIGNSFAMIEAQLIIAAIAQTYQLKRVPDRAVEVDPSVTLRPRHGLWMTLQANAVRQVEGYERRDRAGRE